MTIFAAILFSLRLYNPTDVAIDANVHCGAAVRSVHAGARDVVDLAQCADPIADAPLVAIQTNGDEQRALVSSCVMNAPLFACAHGVATVAVPYDASATYSWSVEGATITSGHGTNRVVLTLGEGPAARVNVNGCEGVIAVRTPLTIESLTMPSSVKVDENATVAWTYPAGFAPASQVLVSDAFDEPVTLDAAARSYTWKPQTSGVHSIELRASYATAIRAEGPAPSHRRRAVAPVQGGYASECAVATRSVEFEVKGCALKTPRLSAPSSVELGSTFIAQTNIGLGQTAVWRVDGGGTIVSGAGTDTIEVKVDDFATSLRVRVQLIAGPGCSTTTYKDITLTPRPACESGTPTASLEIGGPACTKVTVVATFTGKPPFRGDWSDGIPFETNETTLSHDFTKTGTYTIRNFRDALCRGDVVKTAQLAYFGPHATLKTVNGSCMNSKVVATFTGTPPFSGIWSDGSRFTANGMTFERTGLPFGDLKIYNLSDATCAVYDSTIGSNVIPISQTPVFRPDKDLFCLLDPRMPIVMDVYNGAAPHTVYWKDGTITRQEVKGSASVTRIVTTSEWLQEFPIERATSNGCEAEVIGVPKVSYRPAPKIVRHPDAQYKLCGGTDGQASVDRTALHPDAKIHWEISNGRIVSGQGSDVVHFEISPGYATLWASTTYADGFCDGTKTGAEYLYGGEGNVTSLKATPSTFNTGGTTHITFKFDTDVEWFWFKTSDTARSNDVEAVTGGCKNYLCDYKLTDTHGPGVFDFTIEYGGPCMAQNKLGTVQLIVTPP